MTLRVAVASDLHGSLPVIPDADMVILSGDLTGGNISGPYDNTDNKWWRWLHYEFAKWAKDAPPIFAVGGNHDTCLVAYERQLNIPNLTYLQDSMAVFRGLKVFGFPWVRKWDRLAFNLEEADIWRKRRLVPDDTDILICHSPPLGTLDMGLGSMSILKIIEEVQPKLCTFGHIHEAPGIARIGKTWCVNGSGGFRVIEIEH